MFTEMSIQYNMSKPNEYRQQINLRATKKLKNDFDEHAYKKGFSMSGLIKELMRKDMKENLIKPK